MTILETDRLLLRELTADDFAPLYEIFSDPQQMCDYPAPFDAAKTRDWIARNITRYRTDGFGLWGVVLKEENRLIGDCGITLQPICGRQLPEIGYHIHKRYGRQGYATEAARECIHYAFESLGFAAVYSYMKHTNTPSRRVAERNGMRLVTTYADPVNTLTVVYKITAAGFDAQRKRAHGDQTPFADR